MTEELDLRALLEVLAWAAVGAVVVVLGVAMLELRADVDELRRAVAAVEDR